MKTTLQRLTRRVQRGRAKQPLAIRVHPCSSVVELPFFGSSDPNSPARYFSLTFGFGLLFFIAARVSLWS